MPVKDEIKWFKDMFAASIVPALSGTPLSFDLICAIAYQETGELWSQMRGKLPVGEVLRLSCGDTLDAPNRSEFPKRKSDLVGAPHGQDMFELAHQLLVDMAAATGIDAYQRVAQKPDKFVHGYGIFQYDLQFYPEDPHFFLEQKWKTIGGALEKLMSELRGALRDLDYLGKSSLTDRESAFVAIVYNTGFGNFREGKELRQGFFDGVHFYGENIDAFLKIARTVPTPSIGLGNEIRSEAVRARRSIVDVAKSEYDRYHGINEGDQPLRRRIADYYAAGGGDRDLDPTLPDNAWSAAFVSFCVRQSGATPDQFSFSLLHSRFVHDAIANEIADRGVFRGHRITDYAPKLGDIIHHNRQGANRTFEFARDHADYPSHSAIVVEFVSVGDTRHAVTIGGNEAIPHGSGTVGKKLFPLRPDGTIDQGQTHERLISVIENRLEDNILASAPGLYVVRVRSDLKLRGGPGTNFQDIRPLIDGTRLNVLAFEENASGRWAAVDLQGDGIRDGYVFAAFIEPLIA